MPIVPFSPRHTPVCRPPPGALLERRVDFFSVRFDGLKIFFRRSEFPAVNSKNGGPQYFFRPVNNPEIVNCRFFHLLTERPFHASLFWQG